MFDLPMFEKRHVLYRIRFRRQDGIWKDMLNVVEPKRLRGLLATGVQDIDAERKLVASARIHPCRPRFSSVAHILRSICKHFSKMMGDHTKVIQLTHGLACTSSCRRRTTLLALLLLLMLLGLSPENENSRHLADALVAALGWSALLVRLVGSAGLVLLAALLACGRGRLGLSRASTSEERPNIHVGKTWCVR